MNCVRTSFGKPNDEIRGYQGLVDCIGKAAADRIAKRLDNTAVEKKDR